MEYKKEIITVDKDILDYFKVVYFGTNPDRLEAAVFRAYRDFNRTLRLGALDSNERSELRKQVTIILKEEISKLNDDKHMTQDRFDAWHRQTCDMIKRPYESSEIVFSYGQAQKWLNMTFKYLYILGYYSFDSVFGFCHIPIDKYVFQIAKKEFGIPIPTESWSNWTDYDGQYMDYQKKLRFRIKDYEPLRWELKYWISEARLFENKNN